MIIRLCVGAVLSVLAITSVQAQPAMENKDGGVSPVMMTCGADLKEFCEGKMGMPGVQCLMENITDISEPCADALEEASARMREGHGNTDADAED